MTKVIWESIDSETFSIYRHHTARDLAEAFAFESFRDEPSDTILNTLWEMGQGRFSERFNNREQRETLFRLFVLEASFAYVPNTELMEAVNA